MTGGRLSLGRADAGWVLSGSVAVAFAVTAAILAVAINHGLFLLRNADLDGLSSNVVVVAGTSPSSSGVEDGFPSSSLTPGDVAALGNVGYVPDATVVAPTTGERTSVSALSRSTTTDVVGSSERFASVLGYSMASGRFLSPADIQDAAPVAVVGTTVVNSVFAGSNPIGQNLQVDGQNVQIVGVFDSRGFSGGYDQDDLVVIPITTAWKILTPLQSSPIDQVLLRAPSRNRTAALTREVTATLLARHGLVDPAQADFTVRKQADLLAPDVDGARIVRRLLEIGTVAFLLVAAIEAAVRTRRRDRRRGATEPLPASLVDAAVPGLIGAVAGTLLALIGAPLVHRLASTVPTAKVSVYGILAGIGLGLLVTIVPAVLVLFFDDHWGDRPPDLAAGTSPDGDRLVTRSG